MIFNAIMQPSLLLVAVACVLLFVTADPKPGKSIVLYHDHQLGRLVVAVALLYILATC